MSSGGFIRRKRNHTPYYAASGFFLLLALAGIAVMRRPESRAKQLDPPTPVTNQIVSFNTFVGISWDTTVTIIDSIVIRSEKVEAFKKGIHRRMPLSSSDGFGARSFTYRAGHFTLDGRWLEPSSPLQEGNELHYNLGVVNEAPAGNEHKYEWKYSVVNLVGTKGNENGFTWTVTEGWNLPLHSFELLLRLPPSLPREAVTAKGRLIRKNGQIWETVSEITGQPETDSLQPNDKFERFRLPEIPPQHKFQITVSWPAVELKPVS